MKKKNNATRGNLLKAACRIFARKGYRDATVAEICKLAGANIAAVNYHFGNKKTLYIEAWRMSFQMSLEKYAPDGGVSSAAGAKERFRGRVLASLRRFADPKSHEFEIMQKEMANPTGLLFEVVHRSLEPLRYDLYKIVRELTGPRVSENQIHLCLMSIRAQCFDATIRARNRKMLTRAGMKFSPERDTVKIEAIADHITRFSLAGIREIRRCAERT
jgi:AcrR family transcriptional regulator